MSGHSKWTQIKHHKGIIDKKRGKLFSKLVRAIAIAAKTEADPQFNPRLRSTILKARESGVSQDSIDRAITRASETSDRSEELIMEAYSAEGIPMLIEAITDSKNRTVAEVKKILTDHHARWAEPGSVRWIFKEKAGDWQPKFTAPIPLEKQTTFQLLLDALNDHDDVQWVITNAAQST